MADIEVIMMLQGRVKAKIQKNKLQSAISVVDVSWAADPFLCTRVYVHGVEYVVTRRVGF